jgi:hypothetical protein
MERETKRQAGRETQTGKKTDRQTDRWINIQMDAGQTDRQRDELD